MIVLVMRVAHDARLLVAHALPIELLVDRGDVSGSDLAARMHRQCGGDSGALSQYGTARHVTRRGMRDSIATARSSGHQQVAHTLRHDVAERDLEVAAGGWQDQDPVAVDELRVDPDRIVE